MNYFASAIAITSPIAITDSATSPSRYKIPPSRSWAAGKAWYSLLKINMARVPHT